MRNFLITVVIFGVLLTAGFYVNQHFAPVPSLERQIPKLDSSFNRFVHLDTHDGIEIGFYKDQEGWLGVGLLEPSVNKEAHRLGNTALPSRHGSMSASRTLASTGDYFLYGAIGNPSVTQVYVNDTPCDTFKLDETALWYCFFEERPASEEIQGRDAAGSVRYRSSRGG
ncbi:hypothetical protein [Paenibacillus daejeonensis]|uniref:hypothetical protein n=1 Tax=Paenibacillus daejeonensis TaxID=135193 RepID=UPI00035D0CBB|nr:hypothetical protein [Paenibacillus daejeonensis]